MTKLFFLMIFIVVSPLNAQEAKPNIMVIMADDLTYHDLEIYGGQVKTPNLKKLVSEGIKFNRCFQSTAMCSPTKSSLLTGIYPVRNGAYANHSKTYEHIKSIVHQLEPAGYEVALTGKRHIAPETVFPFVYSENSTDPDLNFINKKNDPYELTNIANDPIYKNEMSILSTQLKSWMLFQGDEGEATELKVRIR